MVKGGCSVALRVGSKGRGRDGAADKACPNECCLEQIDAETGYVAECDDCGKVLCGSCSICDRCREDADPAGHLDRALDAYDRWRDA